MIWTEKYEYSQGHESGREDISSRITFDSSKSILLPSLSSKALVSNSSYLNAVTEQFIKNGKDLKCYQYIQKGEPVKLVFGGQFS